MIDPTKIQPSYAYGLKLDDLILPIRPLQIEVLDQLKVLYNSLPLAMKAGSMPWIKKGWGTRNPVGYEKWVSVKDWIVRMPRSPFGQNRFASPSQLPPVLQELLPIALGCALEDILTVFVVTPRHMHSIMHSEPKRFNLNIPLGVSPVSWTSHHDEQGNLLSTFPSTSTPFLFDPRPWHAVWDDDDTPRIAFVAANMLAYKDAAPLSEWVQRVEDGLKPISSSEVSSD